MIRTKETDFECTLCVCVKCGCDRPNTVTFLTGGATCYSNRNVAVLATLGERIIHLRTCTVLVSRTHQTQLIALNELDIMVQTVRIVPKKLWTRKNAWIVFHALVVEFERCI